MSDGPAEKNYAFMVILTVYSALKQPSKGKSTVKKQKKSMKMKELLFQLNEVNYIEFLESICYSMGGVTIEDVPIPFSPFSLADCTMLNHFSFEDFVAIAFPDIAGDLDIQI